MRTNKKMRKRNESNSKRGYEDLWFEAFETIEKEITQNKKSLIEAIEAYEKYRLRRSAGKKNSFNLHKKLGLAFKPDQTPSQRLVVKNGNYTIVPFYTILSAEVINTLIKIINQKREQIDSIVELGSGFGRNIFNLADRLKPYQKENQFEYFSCEFSNSGQETCKNLLKYSTEQKIHVEYIDYKNPDLSFLPKKNYLFFTYHSIEQIPKLKRAVIDEILRISDNCFCLHAEPVGWQYSKTLIKYREETQAGEWEQNQLFLKQKLAKLNRRLFDRYGLSFMKMSHKFGIEIDTDDIDKPDKVSANAAKHSLEKGYNTNLILLLKTIENDGLIKIDSEMVNVYGNKPSNPTTEITWHKLKN
jgi:hypothetical protein